MADDPWPRPQLAGGRHASELAPRCRPRAIAIGHQSVRSPGRVAYARRRFLPRGPRMPEPIRNTASTTTAKSTSTSAACRSFDMSPVAAFFFFAFFFLSGFARTSLSDAGLACISEGLVLRTALAPTGAANSGAAALNASAIAAIANARCPHSRVRIDLSEVVPLSVSAASQNMTDALGTLTKT